MRTDDKENLLKISRKKHFDTFFICSLANTVFTKSELLGHSVTGKKSKIAEAEKKPGLNKTKLLFVQRKKTLFLN